MPTLMRNAFLILPEMETRGLGTLVEAPLTFQKVR